MRCKMAFAALAATAVTAAYPAEFKIGRVHV